MVQGALTEEDTRRWASYMTKGWGSSAAQLAARQTAPLDDWALDWFQLRDFFPPEPIRAARPWKTDQNGKVSYDGIWRLPGKGRL
jgi:hypothetical protein